MFLILSLISLFYSSFKYLPDFWMYSFVFCFKPDPGPLA